jgi:hypothetical protein
MALGAVPSAGRLSDPALFVNGVPPRCLFAPAGN